MEKTETTEISAQQIENKFDKQPENYNSMTIKWKIFKTEPHCNHEPNHMIWDGELWNVMFASNL